MTGTGTGKKKSSRNTSLLFLIIVLAIYAGTAMVSPELALVSLEKSLMIFTQILPVLAIVFILMFVFNLIVSPKTVKRFLGRDAGIKGWVVAVVGGILSAGPIYVWYPLLADLQKKGMRKAFSATFLYNRAIKLPLLPVMIAYFGITYTAVLSACMIVASLIVGISTERCSEHQPSAGNGTQTQ